MRPAVRCPGPTNQKSVPGLLQAAVGTFVPLVCSTSRPWARDPLAWTTTPPRTAAETTVVVLGFPLGAAWARALWSTLTTASRGVPRWVMLSSVGPGVLLPGPPSRVTIATPWPPDAVPLPALAGADITAMPLPWLNCVPGSGQACTTEVTGTECGARGATPALSEMECFRPASAYRPPSRTTTTAANRTRLPRRFLTSHPPQARRRPQGPRPR